MLRITPLFASSSALFALTAGVGVWAAPDRGVALRRFAWILIGVVLSNAFLLVRRRQVAWLAGLGAIAAIAAAFVTITFGLHFGGSGSTAGALIILIPMVAGATLALWIAGFRKNALILAAGLPVALFGLVLARERTAWFSLLAGAVAACAAHWRFTAGHASRYRYLVDIGAVLAVAVLAGGFAGALTVPSMGQFLAVLEPHSSYSRPAVWHDGLTLVRDYPFSGSGLGQTAMVFSSYVLLLHVPFVSQTYNLLMQIAVEQGLPGLLAWLSMLTCGVYAALITCACGPAWARACGSLTVGALAAAFVHGLVDASLYASRLVPVLFLPLAATMLLLVQIEQKDRRPAAILSRATTAVISALLPFLTCGLLFLLLPGAWSRLRANLGCVKQTRAELSVYHWPEWPIQDELRRSRAVDLAGAIQDFQAALTTDPHNITANRRLGQIALSRGDYAAAQQHLEGAYRAAPAERPTCQMLGEVYAVRGEAEPAVAVWKSCGADPQKLALRQWWYRSLEGQKETEGLNRAVTFLKQGRDDDAKLR